MSRFYRSLVLCTFILIAGLFLNSCKTFSGEEDLTNLSQSYKEIFSEINYVYDNNFTLTKSNAKVILDHTNKFTKKIESVNKKTTSIFFSRFVYNSEYINELLSTMNDLNTYLIDFIKSPKEEEVSTREFIKLLHRLHIQMYNMQDIRANTAQSINTDYIKYFMIFIVFFVVLCIVLLVIFFLELKQKDIKIQETSKFLDYTIKGQEEEKRRVARELHDTVAQDMRYIIQLTKKLESSQLQKTIIEKQDQCLTEVRDICSSFIPQDIENKDIAASLNDIIQKITSQTNIQVSLTILDNINFKNMDDERFLHFYRIIQEILTNAAKHSKASEISVLIKKEHEAQADSDGGSFIHLIITDDGIGIDKQILDSIKEQKIATPKHHFGLKNIMQRVQLLKGTINFTSDKDFGTEVNIIFPEEC